MNSKPELSATDADTLVQALRARKKPKLFEKLRAFYRSRGFSDAEIVRAMAKSREMVNPIRVIGQ
jgi:hypothetical protein